MKKLAKIHKSNELNQANFSDFGLSCYRVLLNLISQIQRHDNEGNQLQLPVVARECSLSAKSYAVEFKISGNTAYETLKEAVNKLMKSSIAMKSDRGILKINVCSQAHYIQSEGRIDIRFTEEIMPYLAELGKNFTMYNLAEISGFNSIYTTRLYELLIQYKTTGTLDISVENLRFRLGCTAIFARYNDFKRRTIEHAIEEINSLYEMNLKFEEIKLCRKVNRIIFTFTPTLMHKTYDHVRKRIRTQLTRPKRTTKNIL